MVIFQVPMENKVSGGKEEYFRFSVYNRNVMFAGSRYGFMPQEVCQDLLNYFHNRGFSFMVGCATGIDDCFRSALANSSYQDKHMVACAFNGRAKTIGSKGLFASSVVPPNLPPAAALRRRTLWMVRRTSMVVLVPECLLSRVWGPGSKLVFKAALYHLKPVFVVGETPPKESVHYKVLESNLFGVVKGYWVVPHPITEGGACYEEY